MAYVKKECIRDIALLEGPWRDLDEAKQQELIQRGMLVMRGCSRSSIVGHKDDIASIRAELEGKLEYFEGAHAYGRLLQVVSGQLSRTPGENQIVRQFRNSWEKFSAGNPEKSLPLRHLYDAIIADNSLIRNRVTHDLKPAFYESTACRLAEHENGDTVLLVCGAEKGDTKLDETTQHLARQLANHNSHGIKRLLITHPDPDIAKRMLGKINRLGLSVKPELVNFNEMFNQADKAFDYDKIFSVQRMYVCLPMQQYPEADAQMVHMWGQREGFGGKLVHLGGAKKHERVSRGAWKDGDFFSAIMPEGISAQQSIDKQRNVVVVTQGGVAALNCGLSRAHGKNPIGNCVTLNTDEYVHRTGLNSGKEPQQLRI